MKSVALRPFVVAALAFVVAAFPAGVSGQTIMRQQVRGTVVDDVTDQPVAGATVRVDGPQGAATVTTRGGSFLLNEVPAGDWQLVVAAPGFEPQTHPMNLELGGQAQVAIRLAPNARAAFRATGGADAVDPLGSLGWVADPARLRAAAASADEVADLLREALPQLREVPRPGDQGCFEIPDAQAAPSRGMSQPGYGEAFAVSCEHPDVYVDGVLIADPVALYRWRAVRAVRQVQAIPPDQTGTYFPGARFGVLLVGTDSGGLRAAADGLRPSGSPLLTPQLGVTPVRRKTNFDWSLDPAGHSFARTFLGAAAGNAAGLAAGLAVGGRCIYIEDRTEEIEFKCGNAGVAGVGLAALALPALGNALGARLAGGTDRSHGRLVPAMIGAGMGVLPGYIFALSTVGGGVETMNAIGAGFLLIGAPFITTLADRLYRELR